MRFGSWVTILLRKFLMRFKRVAIEHSCQANTQKNFILWQVTVMHIKYDIYTVSGLLAEIRNNIWFIRNYAIIYQLSPNSKNSWCNHSACSTMSIFMMEFFSETLKMMDPNFFFPAHFPCGHLRESVTHRSICLKKNLAFRISKV